MAETDGISPVMMVRRGRILWSYFLSFFSQTLPFYFCSGRILSLPNSLCLRYTVVSCVIWTGGGSRCSSPDARLQAGRCAPLLSNRSASSPAAAPQQQQQLAAAAARLRPEPASTAMPLARTHKKPSNQIRLYSPSTLVSHYRPIYKHTCRPIYCTLQSNRRRNVHLILRSHHNTIPFLIYCIYPQDIQFLLTEYLILSYLYFDTSPRTYCKSVNLLYYFVLFYCLSLYCFILLLCNLAQEFPSGSIKFYLILSYQE